MKKSGPKYSISPVSGANMQGLTKTPDRNADRVKSKRFIEGLLWASEINEDCQDEN
jgi:hypothetical protein